MLLGCLGMVEHFSQCDRVIDLPVSSLTRIHPERLRLLSRVHLLPAVLLRVLLLLHARHRSASWGCAAIEVKATAVTVSGPKSGIEDAV